MRKMSCSAPLMYLLKFSFVGPCEVFIAATKGALLILTWNVVLCTIMLYRIAGFLGGTQIWRFRVAKVYH
jgi:hypothetical protein